jgi:hypothetical protein
MPSARKPEMDRLTEALYWASIGFDDRYCRDYTAGSLYRAHEALRAAFGASAGYETASAARRAYFAGVRYKDRRRS